jgi:hypothetical protein
MERNSEYLKKIPEVTLEDIKGILSKPKSGRELIHLQGKEKTSHPKTEYVKGLTLLYPLYISEFNYGDLRFNDCHFNKVTMNGNVEMSRLLFDNCSFEKFEIIENSSDKSPCSIDHLVFQNCQVDIMALQIGLKTNHLVCNSNFIKSFIFTGAANRIEFRTFSEPGDEKLNNALRDHKMDSFKLYTDRVGQAGIIRLNTKVLHIQGENTETRLQLSGCTVSQALLKNLRIKEVRIFDFKYEGQSSELKTLNVDFVSFPKEVSQLFQAERIEFGAGTSIRDYNKNEVDWPRELTGSYADQWLAYREMKIMKESLGEFEAQSYYFSKEMEAYYLHSKRFKRSTGEWVNFGASMWLPYWVSRFGQSTARPLMIFLFLHLLLVWALIAGSTGIGLEWTGHFTSESFWRGVDLYLHTIFPTHRDSFYGGTLNPSISSIQRLFSLVFFYHIIISSRRHLKNL